MAYNTIDILEECSICLEIINNNIVKLECNHIFHDRCIKMWICNYMTTCPICRIHTKYNSRINMQPINLLLFLNYIRLFLTLLILFIIIVSMYSSYSTNKT